MGYANCCTCPECREREKNRGKKPEAVRQPWEARGVWTRPLPLTYECSEVDDA